MRKQRFSLFIVLTITTLAAIASAQRHPGMMPGLTKEQAQKAAQKMRQEYLSGQNLNQLKPEQFLKMLEVFKAAEDTQGVKDVTIAWFDVWNADDKSRSALSAANMLVLARQLKRFDQTDAINQLVANVELRLKDKKADKIVIGQLADLDQLATLSGSSSLREDISKRMSQFVMQDGNFRNNLAPFEIILLAKSFSRNDNTLGQKKLAEFIAGDYLAQPGLAGAIEPTGLIDLTGIVRTSKDPVARNQLLDKLRKFLDENTLQVAKFNRNQLIEFSKQVYGLGGNEDLSEKLVMQWLGVSNIADQLDLKSRKNFTQAALGNDAALRNIIDELSAENASEKLSTAEYKVGSALLARTLRGKQGYEFSQRLLQGLGKGKTLSVIELNGVAQVLATGRISLTKEQANGLIRTLKALDEKDVVIDDDTYQYLAKAFRKTLRNLGSNLQDADGRFNLPIAKMIAWTCDSEQRKRRFYQKLTSMKKDTAGDNLARIELARGYVVGLIHEGKSGRAATMSYIRLALVATGTDQMRLRCLEELALAAQASGQYAPALQAIESVQNQFNGKEKARAIELGEMLRKGQVREQRRQEYASVSEPWQKLFSRKRRFEFDKDTEHLRMEHGGGF